MPANDFTAEMERALLSAIFYDTACFEEIYSRLKVDDFLYKPHQHIYAALIELYHQDLPLDEEFIMKKNTPKTPIDQEELFAISGTNPIIAIDAYVTELKDRSTKRKLNHLAMMIKKESQDVQLNSGIILEHIEQQLYRLSQENVQHDFKEAEQITLEAIEFIKEHKEQGNNVVVGLDTGFKELNKQTTGFGKGDLVIIAARPAMGKTAFALNIALKTLENNKGVVIFSLEMGADQLMLRMLSNKTSIALQDLRIGNLDDGQWENLSHAAQMMSKKALFVDDGGVLSISILRSKIRRLKAKYPQIELVIVDYLQLMIGAGNQDRHLEVSEISRGLKMLARELEIPIIALSQLNRALEARSDKRPMLSDLRESGAIEQDADLILFIYRDDVYKQKAEKEKEEQSKKNNDKKPYASTFKPKMEEEAEIIIGKQRNGPTGTVKLIFHKAFSRFVDNELLIEYESKPTQLTSMIEMPGI